MTEVEWLTCTDPRAMLHHLGPQAGERKLRLFACACCRRVWQDLRDERSRRAVEVAERYADALATEEELRTASDGACAAWDKARERAVPVTRAERWAFPAGAAAYNVAIPLGWWGGAPDFKAPDEIIREAAPNPRAEGSAQCALLRDIFGNPFHPHSLNPARLEPPVVALARALYDNRAFDRMPALGDVLEKAGCTSVELLTHCRKPGEHALGCWALDGILAKV